MQFRKNPATGTTHRSRAQRRIVGMWVSRMGGAKPCHLPRCGVGGTLGENIMARDFKREYELQKERGDTEGQLERQRARRMYDKKGVARMGKDIDHKMPISKGGKSNLQNLRLRDRSANRKDNKKN